MRVLADTGILLRLGDPADALHAAVNAAFRAVRGRGDELVMAAQNAAEFWNVCTRPATSRGGWGLGTAEADRRLRAVEITFPVLSEPPAAYAIWRRLVVDPAVNGRQAHDARLVALMTAHGMTLVLTLNAGDFARFPGIVEVAPAAFTPPASASP